MKIVHVLWGLPTGGTESMLVDVANQQVESDRVHIVVLNDNTNTDLLKKISPRVVVHQCRRPLKSKNVIYIIKLNLLLLKINPDIVHCHSEGLVKYIFLPYKIVRTIHSTMCSGKDYHRFKKLFCISKGVKKFTESQGFFNTELVYNGIDSKLIKCKESFERGDVVRFLNVGRFQHVKGQWLLIQAANILKSKYGVDNFHIDFIGEGESLQECKSLVQSNDLENNVSFLGLRNRDYFYPKLCEYDCYVQPSISEGFGIVIAEAMSAKLPVIISDLEGPMEIIDNGKYGVYFESGNALELASKMYSFMMEKTDEQMVEDGYDYVRENFSIESTSRKYIEEYKRIIKKK